MGTFRNLYKLVKSASGMGKSNVSLIMTVPPFGCFSELAKEKIVEGVRLNTNLDISDHEKVLNHLKDEASGKDVWIDLKGRQLRIKAYEVYIARDREVHRILLNHKIKVNVPADVYIDNGRHYGIISKLVNNEELLVESSVEKRQGLPLASEGEIGIRPGMSVSILDNPSLEIEGYLTERDKAYIEAAKKTGLHNYMLSFTEEESDIKDIFSLDSDARIIAKIESQKGMNFIKKIYGKYSNRVNLMAARGDLYLELPEPHDVISASKKIITRDKRAVMASRMLESLANLDEMPRCSEISDVYCSMMMGYERFLIGDDVCRKKDSIKAVMGILKLLQDEYSK